MKDVPGHTANHFMYVAFPNMSFATLPSTVENKAEYACALYEFKNTIISAKLRAEIDQGLSALQMNTIQIHAPLEWYNICIFLPVGYEDIVSQENQFQSIVSPMVLSSVEQVDLISQNNQFQVVVPSMNTLSSVVRKSIHISPNQLGKRKYSKENQY